MTRLSTTPDFFVPAFETLIKAEGVTAALVYGIIWRYCQLREGVCRASIDTLGERTGLCSKTVARAINRLKNHGFILDRTPGVRGVPHHILLTGRLEQIKLETYLAENTSLGAGTTTGQAEDWPQAAETDETGRYGGSEKGGSQSPIFDQNEGAKAGTQSPIHRTLSPNSTDKLSDGDGTQSPTNQSIKESLNKDDLKKGFQPCEIWKTICAELQLQLSRSDYHTWVASTEAISWDGSRLVVGTGNEYAVKWLAQNAAKPGEKWLKQHFGAGKVKFVVQW